MIENMPGLLVALFLAGAIFPFPTFVCVCAFCVGRVLHQTGYAGGYGGHGAGFAISTLASTTLEGLMTLVALAATPLGAAQLGPHLDLGSGPV